MNRGPGERTLRFGKRVGWAFSIVLAAAQSVAYYNFLSLSLGPRVVLQPWLMQRGFLLYEHIADEHAPLMYLLLQLMQPLASDSLTVAKVALASSLFVLTLLAFWAGSLAKNWLTGSVAALFLAIWSPFFGYGKLWHETFLALVYATLLVLWSRPSAEVGEKKEFALTGLILGGAVLFKQHALAVLGALGLWEVFVCWRTRSLSRRTLLRIISFGLLALLPVLVYTGYHYLRTGSIKDFVFWTVTFNFINNYRDIASLAPRPNQLKTLLPAYLLIVPFLARSLKSVITGETDKTWYRREGRALVLLIAGSLTAYPRFGFFHLQASLPALAWLSTIQLTRSLTNMSLTIAKRKVTQFLLLAGRLLLVLFWIVHTTPAYYRSISSDKPRRIWEYSNLVPLAKQIGHHIESDESIYVFPDDEATANLYYLLRRTPPKYWSPTSYPWFTLDILKPKIIDALDQASPEWVVYFPGRWGIERHGKEIFAYIQSHYRPSSMLSWAEGEVRLMERLPDQQVR